MHSFSMRLSSGAPRRNFWGLRPGHIFPALVLSAALAGCGTSVNSTGYTPAPDAMCTQEGQHACYGNTYSVCNSAGYLTPVSDCGALVCSDSLGCVDCAPGSMTCVGDEVHRCGADGKAAELLNACAFGERCRAGTCVDACEVEASEFIYLLDDQNELLSFAPRNDAHTLSVIGKIGCMAQGGQSPNSMSIDRKARAWVNYDSGEIFLVSTKDASCAPSMYTAGTSGITPKVGMGFVADLAGSGTESLYLASFGTSSILYKMTATSQTPVKIGSLPMSQVSPEMTGTGDATLFAYFPSSVANEHRIARIDKATAQILSDWKLPPLPAQANAWAFAHWGGRFYMFVTPQNIGNQIYRFDPASNEYKLILDKTSYRIVGAGVSTCAPTRIG
ncbi:MAG: hypothetical protein U1A78_33985 [Polyangia bacterium]